MSADTFATADARENTIRSAAAVWAATAPHPATAPATTTTRPTRRFLARLLRGNR